MAEVNSNAGSNRHPGNVRCKKLSTRIDLTPMVDLGFLLITFFIFTTTLSEPKVLKLIMPPDESSEIGESAALTIIPAGKNEIFYYHGDLTNALKQGAFGHTNYSLSNGIGDIIRKKQVAMDRIKSGFRKDLMLIIKPSEDSKYENLINLLDEVLINDVPHYAIVHLSIEEKEIVALKKVN